jgi:hypothetical protein
MYTSNNPLYRFNYLESLDERIKYMLAWPETRSRLGMASPNISKAAPSSSKGDASKAAETHALATPWKLWRLRRLVAHLP